MDARSRLGDLESADFLARALDTDPDEAEFTKNVIDKILADHRDAR